jgi:hypothetical protein
MPAMIITPVKNSDGTWKLTDGNGNDVQEGFPYRTRREAMDAARQIWPPHIWHSRPRRSGWEIDTTEN